MSGKRRRQDVIADVPDVSVDWTRHAIILTAIVLACVFAYSNSTQGSFHFDDEHSIVRNSSIRSLNPAGMWGNPRFVGFYSFAVNYYFSGLDDIRGWHYFNIGLHTFCTLLLYVFLSLLVKEAGTPGSRIPAVAALLFAVHPICSEPVNYIQARHALFYTLFSLSGVVCTILFCRAASKIRRAIFAAGVAASAILGGLSKEIGICYVMLAIGLYLFTFRWKRTEGKGVSLTVAAMGAAAAIIAILAISRDQSLYLLFQGGSHPLIGRVSYVSYLLTEAQVFWRYVWLMVPRSAGLSIDHCVGVAGTQTVLQVLTAFVAVFGIGAAVIFAIGQRTKRPLLSLLILWAVLGHLPYVLIQGSAEFMVEYRAYMPAVGFVGLAALGLDRAATAAARRLSLHNPFPLVAAAVGLLMVICISQTRARNPVWLNEYTLWVDAVEKSPGEARVHYRLGNVYREMGETERAIASYEKAIGLNGNYVEVHNNLANVYYKAGRTDEAIAAYGKALEVDPGHAPSHHNLGLAYKAAGRTEDAIASFMKAIEFRPDYTKAYSNLGIVYNSVGRRQEAIDSYSRAIEINPDYVEAHNNLANIYSQTGRTEDAITSYGEALRIDPDHAVARHNLGLAYKSIGEDAKAIASYEKALENDPRFAPAHAELAAAYHRQKRYGLAIEHCDKARRLGYMILPELINALEPHR